MTDSPAPRSPRLRTRPRLERLEERTTPAVFNVADGDVTGLISAINTANGNGEADTINLAAGGTYTLTAANNSSSGSNGLPVVGADGGHALTINGNGATITRGAEAPAFRILLINGGNLTLNDLTVANGSSTSGFNGGGIRDNGTLTMTDCTLTGNAAAGANADGGALDVRFGRTATLTNCVISGNTAGRDGGGVNAYGTATLTACTVSGNTAGRIGGGAAGYYGTINLTACTISGNHATSEGGGVGAYFGTLNLSNCTISGNTVSNVEGGGGGLFAYDSTVSLANCTVSGNTASIAGGLHVYSDRSVKIANTIVAGNTADSSPDVGGDVTSLGYNLIGDTSGSTGFGANDLVNVNPKLGALQNNGGPVQTIALLAGSPAIDAGDPAFAPPPGTDARGSGFNRVVNGRLDIGAYEFQPSATVTTLLASPNPSDLGQSVIFSAAVAGTAAGSNVPQGTVTFFDGGTPLGTVALVGGTARFSTSALTAGSHTIRAVYNGFAQGDYAFASSSASVAQTVNAPPTPPAPPAPPPTPTPGPTAVHLTASAAGPGGAPEVIVFNGDGSVRFRFLAYDADFTGGVYVAVGDVDGDGIDDVVTGAGDGGGPHVRVFSGKDGSLLREFMAYDPALRGGVFVAIADVDGDGSNDIITGAGTGGGPHVRAWRYADLAELASFFAYDPGFTGGVRVAAGDVDGDGRAEIVTGPGPGMAPLVKVFGSDGTLRTAFAGYDGSFSGGVFVAAGDLDGDGRADVVTGPGYGGAPLVRVFDGQSGAQSAALFAYVPDYAGGVTVAVRDLGAGPVLLTGASDEGGPDVREFRGTDFADLGSFFAFDPAFRGGVFVG